jgi:transposase
MTKTNKKRNNLQSGSILILVLVFAAVFTTIGTGLVGMVSIQHKLSSQKVASSQALHIAEAGVNYYRWHLVHSPDDFQDGTGGPGPYIHDYKDPEGTVIGKFSLEIAAPSGCESAVKIQSTGWALSHPQTKRTVQVRYGKQALVKYAFLTNEDVWFSNNEGLKGEFHSNGGIRMDGTQNSIAFSAKEDYICDSIHGCSSSDCDDPCHWVPGEGCECPGIWGAGHGGPDGLWQFPIPSIDFSKITQDLAILKSEAQTSGIYLGSSGLGYHIHFKNNGTFDLYQVTKKKAKVWGHNGEKWIHESNDIENETFLQNYSFPANCEPIFAADDVWVDGEVNGKITLVAARLPDVSHNNAKIIINGDITYANSNSVLGLIGQKDILIPLYSPDDLTIEAAMLAQKGHVFRYHYPSWESHTYYIRENIRVFGSIITNTIWTFSWVNGATTVSGYKNTDMDYDSSLTFDPPPYFPTSGDYQFISWEEVE